MDVAGSLLFWLVRPLFSATGPVPLAPPPTAVFIITSTLVVALAIVIAVSSKLRRRLHRGPHGQNARAGLTKLEETGIIDMAAIYAAVIFFMYGLFLESSLCAFAFGIGTIYFLDHASSYIHRKRLRHIRSQGVALYLEEFCVFEIALLTRREIALRAPLLAQAVAPHDQRVDNLLSARRRSLIMHLA